MAFPAPPQGPQLMLRVELEHRFGNTALHMAFEAPTPGVIALFGPSGAGKSSLLNAIAGLFRPKRAQVELDGVPLHGMRPERRRIGYVFQDGRLFPHMSVRANLLYGLRRAPPGTIGFDEAIALLGLAHLLQRRPHTLSGGERQRVAIGRALLSSPRMLLMDEPLSALDQARRDEILPYLARLHGALSIPIVYASHALDEVMGLADTLVLVEAGRVRAAGPLTEMVSRVDLPLAAREDAAGLLHGVVHSHVPERRLTAISCGADLLWVPMMQPAEGTHVRLRVPAREVILALEAPRHISVNNIIPAVIADIAEDQPGHAALVSLEIGGGQLLARVTLDAAERLRLQPDRRVLALIKSMSVDFQRT
jgi:molybdate transport system ATP-binding protein